MKDLRTTQKSSNVGDFRARFKLGTRSCSDERLNNCHALCRRSTMFSCPGRTLDPSADLCPAIGTLQMWLCPPGIKSAFKWWGNHKTCSLTACNSVFLQGKSNYQLPTTQQFHAFQGASVHTAFLLTYYSTCWHAAYMFSPTFNCLFPSPH